MIRSLRDLRLIPIVLFATISLFALNSASTMAELLLSPVFHKSPGVKMALSEGGIGWMPYMLERIDKVWRDKGAWNEVRDGRVADVPSSYFRRQFFVSFFDDDHGLRSVDEIGPDCVMYETDYPHADSSWPNSHEQIKRTL